MARLIAWLTVHESGCQGNARDGCCEWRLIEVDVTFDPDPRSSMRDRVRLARMAALFKARAMVSQGE